MNFLKQNWYKISILILTGGIFVILLLPVILGNSIFPKELTDDPSYLYSDDFNKSNVVINGVGLGDSIEEIPNDLIEDRYRENKIISTTNHMSYKYASTSKTVTELRVGWDALKN